MRLGARAGWALPSLSTTVNPPGPLGDLGDSPDSGGCKEALTVPRRGAQEAAPPRCGQGGTPGPSSHPGARRQGHRTTYQEAFKFLRFCDVDPAVFLYHLDVLHLVVEPGRGTQAAVVTARPTYPRPLGVQAQELRPCPGPTAHTSCSTAASFRASPHPTGLWARLLLLVRPYVHPPCLFQLQTPRSAGEASGPEAPRLPPATSCLGIGSLSSAPGGSSSCSRAPVRPSQPGV